MADAAQLTEARDEALEQAEAEARMREELEAHLAEAPGEDAAGRATSSATPSPRRMPSEYIVGWVLLVLALGAAIVG